MRRLCQFERVPCESVSIRRTVCPAWMAARARPMASVLLPLPPFWVASTIVCIVGSLGVFVAGFAVRSTLAAHSALPSILALDCRPDPGKPGESRLSESPNPATMTDYWAHGYSGTILAQQY